jgi:hypothetical protein
VGLRFSKSMREIAPFAAAPQKRAVALIAIAPLKFGTTQGSERGKFATYSSSRCRPVLLHPSLSFCIRGHQAVGMAGAPGNRNAAISALPIGLKGWHS